MKGKGGFTGSKYFSIVSSTIEPADVEYEFLSENVCEDEDEDEDEEEEDESDEVEDDSNITHSPMVPWQQVQSFRSAASDITVQQNSFIFNALHFQQNLTSQHQQMLQDQKRQQDELIRQMQELRQMVVEGGGKANQPAVQQQQVALQDHGERITHLEQEQKELGQLRSAEQLRSGAQAQSATTVAHSSSSRMKPSNSEPGTIANPHSSSSNSSKLQFYQS
ncbi:hypothetical protein BGZ89_006639 [Linnemannia elongata]|nr:hypothetical protein BGZ89_006639 [Linnemannia elongata]